MTTVVKIGGSLFPEYLDDLYEVFCNCNEDIVLVNGGGDLANTIRDFNKQYEYSDDVNHWSSIKCMDIIGELISDKFNKIKAIKQLDKIKDIHKNGNIPLILCYDLLCENDPLNHSWDVTSDSIACWIANQINAKLLILTNINGIYTGNIYSNNKKLIKNISANELLIFEETCVDKCLPELLLKYKVDCFILNGKYPDRVLSFLNSDFSINDNLYTYIGGN